MASSGQNSFQISGTLLLKYINKRNTSITETPLGRKIYINKKTPLRVKTKKNYFEKAARQKILLT